jgi:hypothetical protein
MSSGREYAASFNGIKLKAQKRVDGAVEILIPNTMKEGELLVLPL